MIFMEEGWRFLPHRELLEVSWHPTSPKSQATLPFIKGYEYRILGTALKLILICYTKGLKPQMNKPWCIKLHGFCAMYRVFFFWLLQIYCYTWHDISPWGLSGDTLTHPPPLANFSFCQNCSSRNYARNVSPPPSLLFSLKKFPSIN